MLPAARSRARSSLGTRVSVPDTSAFPATSSLCVGIVVPTPTRPLVETKRLADSGKILPSAGVEEAWMQEPGCARSRIESAQSDPVVTDVTGAWPEAGAGARWGSRAGTREIRDKTTAGRAFIVELPSSVDRTRGPSIAAPARAAGLARSAAPPRPGRRPRAGRRPPGAAFPAR